MISGILDWIEERTGLVSGIRHFLNEDIPASAGWHQVFGSVALFAFLMQVFSGLMLAVNYAPTPGEAWESLRYIVTQVTAGSIIRAMHHWGASAMIVVVGIHMAQAFLWGAYKKPREATWIAGVVLLLLTLAFGLTGYLLVWDNRAYWGTVVTTQITGSAPGGSLLLRILGTDGTSIGRVTFARFYASHVTLLPIVTALIIGFHVYLVRKHGITPAAGDEHRPKKKFFPEQVFKDTVGMFLWFAAVATMVALVKVPLGPAADPTDTSFVPRPEWYFLFLFQMLKLFPGPLEVFGSVVLPGIAMAMLALTPFLDRGKMVKITRRTGAIAVTVLAVIGWTGLTARAVVTTPPQMEEDGTVEVQAWQKMPPSQVAGIGAFRKANCTGCHTLGRSGAGPDLTKAVSTKTPDWLSEHFRKPGEDSVNGELTDTQVKALVQLVTKRDDDGLDAWAKAPESAIAGAVVYQVNQCGGCHMLNGEGGKTAPLLNGVHLRHDRVWVKGHFGDPEKYSPGSNMLPFDDLTPTDLDAITDYVMAIPK